MLKFFIVTQNYSFRKFELDYLMFAKVILLHINYKWYSIIGNYIGIHILIKNYVNMTQTKDTKAVIKRFQKIIFLEISERPQTLSL